MLIFFLVFHLFGKVCSLILMPFIPRNIDLSLLIHTLLVTTIVKKMTLYNKDIKELLGTTTTCVEKFLPLIVVTVKYIISLNVIGIKSYVNYKINNEFVI